MLRPMKPPAGSNAVAEDDEVQINAAWGAWPKPPTPQMPPHLVNFQAWLAAQGLTVQDGIVPEDNLFDSAA